MRQDGTRGENIEITYRWGGGSIRSFLRITPRSWSVVAQAAGRRLGCKSCSRIRRRIFLELTTIPP